jgi:hypothetical protein
MARLILQDAVCDLYQKARADAATTSTKRLRVLADFCVQELATRGLAGALVDPEIPGFARAKDWDVSWSHRGKARLAISLKSLFTNLGGTVPNRIDDLIGEVANLQMFSPETVVGYVMAFNVEEDAVSKKHGCSWGDLLRRRLLSIAGRRAPHWTIGTIEAFSFVEVNFAEGPLLVSGEESVATMFDVLADQVYERNPDLVRPDGGAP